MSFSTEKVFDVLPCMVDIYDKLNLDEYRKKIAEDYKNKEVDATTLGIDVIKYILKNSKNIKEECFEIVSIFEEKPVEEIKTQNFIKTYSSINKIFNDKEVLDFFESAIK